MSLPLALILGYLWTYTIYLSETRELFEPIAADSFTMGIMVGVIILPMTLLFLTLITYLLFSLKQVSPVGLELRIKSKFSALASFQFLGTCWGWLLLGRYSDVITWPLFMGSLLALVFVLLPWLFFPRLHPEIREEVGT